MIKISGLRELQNRLDVLSKSAEKLDGQHNVPVAELLTPSFLSKHTRVHSVDELFEGSGFKIESAEDFEAVPDEKWDAYVCSISDFSNWEAMLSEAAKEWVSKQLRF
jgi:hypothetical protein